MIGLINKHALSWLAPLHSFPWVSYAQFCLFSKNSLQKDAMLCFCMLTQAKG